MSVPAPPRQHRPTRTPSVSPAVALVVAAVGAAAAVAAVSLAPAHARTWTLAVAAVAWVCVVATVLVSRRLVARARRTAAAQTGENGLLVSQAAQWSAETAHLVNVTLPGMAKRLRDGAGTADEWESTQLPADPQLRRLVRAFATTAEEGWQRAAALDGERRQAQDQLEQAVTETEAVTRRTLPAAVARLREGRSADRVLAELELPKTPVVRALAESSVRELARSERRASAAQAASAKALSRVQAKTVSMLADLRDMQERHGEEVFGDLLKLDHSTSQLGLMTDRLALLMGGRSSRAWNKPIVMESILRGAVGRIAAYQRVRLHCSTAVAISGFAAEDVMHLLAELMDNAANFSPPIDEVHAYVEERSAGVVVTIEDSGLKMADAAMRHAEEAVAGRTTDLASLRSTRLGLAVVGRLAVKYGISVNYRPSSRGGTGVVVLIPPQLLAQQREPAPREASRRPAGVAAAAPAPLPPAPPAPVPDVAPRRTVEQRSEERPQPPEHGRFRRSTDDTLNGLPVRTPGRTMAEAEREREQRRSDPEAEGGVPAERHPPRDAGTRFGAFDRGRRSAGARPDTRLAPESGPAPRPRPGTGTRSGSEPPAAP